MRCLLQHRAVRRLAAALLVSPVNKFDYRLVGPVTMLDDWERWEKHWSTIFLKGQRVQHVPQ